MKVSIFKRTKELTKYSAHPGIVLSTLIAAIILCTFPTLADVSNRSAPTTSPSTASNDQLQSSMADRIASDLRETLGRRGSNIHVRITNNVVLLSGTVDSLLAKDVAAGLVYGMPGIGKISNKIEVTPPTRSDSQIRSDIAVALALDPAVDLNQIDADVKEGVVTLSGTVDSIQEREFAAGIARGIKGVKATRNNIEVQDAQRRADSEIEAEIKSQMEAAANIDASDIEVKVNKGGFVSLSGTVASQRQRATAMSKAWVAGVKAVNGENLQIGAAPDSQSDTKQRAALSKKTTKDTLASNQGTPNTSSERSSAEESSANQTGKAAEGKITEKESEQEESTRTSTSPSEDQILSNLKKAYSSSVRLSRSDIKPEFQDGVVELAGTVDTLAAKKEATRLAIPLKGIKAVKNNLQVDPPQSLSDNEIEANVRAALLRDSLLEYEEISIWVYKGRVDLTGDVDSRVEKARAEHITSRIPGVIAIQNNLMIIPDGEFSTRQVHKPQSQLANSKQTTAPESPDKKLAKKIEAQLFWSPFVDADQVDVSVQRGIVTLKGIVSTPDERSDAEANAYDAGADKVRNLIQVRQGKRGVAKSDAQLRQDIENQLTWSLEADAEEVDVSVKDGVVTLKGTVDSEDERRDVEANAFDAGAEIVRNRLKVTSSP